MAPVADNGPTAEDLERGGSRARSYLACASAVLGLSLLLLCPCLGSKGHDLPIAVWPGAAALQLLFVALAVQARAGHFPSPTAAVRAARARVPDADLVVAVSAATLPFGLRTWATLVRRAGRTTVELDLRCEPLSPEWGRWGRRVLELPAAELPLSGLDEPLSLPPYPSPGDPPVTIRDGCPVDVAAWLAGAPRMREGRGDLIGRVFVEERVQHPPGRWELLVRDLVGRASGLGIPSS